MYNRLRLLCLTVLFVFSSLPLALAAVSGVEPQKPAVLFLSSYSITFDTLPAQLRGIREALPADQYRLDVEFMDTKRFPGKEDEAFFYAALKNKLAQLPRYDAVLIGDDAALVFAMQHQQELFAQIPMVFLCVNNISLAEQAAKSPWITGIVEKSAYRRNLDLILQLFPGTKNIVAVTDRTLTAQGDQQQFQDCIPEYPNLHFNLINASECTQIELAERIAAVRGNSVLLYLNLFEDKDRNVYTIESGGSFIAAHARVPVFRFSIGALDNGILGGIMISFEESGRQAGSMVREILQQGRRPQQIPVVMDTPVYGYFDKNVLDRYDVPLWKLPDGSRILHRDPSFFELHRELSIAAGGVLLLLFLVIGALWLNSERRKRLMNEDYLTKLHNRMWITQRLQMILGRQDPCAVLIFDLDGFKHINDTYGHLMGDMLLQQTSRRMQTALGRHYILARYGGDEFLSLADTADRSILRQSCEDMMEAFKSPFYLDNEKIRISLSIGVACSPADSTAADQLMIYADAALYTVKTAGKCGYRFFDGDIRSKLEWDVQVRQLLEDAMENDGFEMVYQPQFQAATQELTGFEALIRLKNGAAYPNEFISVAEQSRMILAIGRIVTRKVIRQLGAWLASGYAPISVALNFSNHQLHDREYPTYLQSLLQEYQVPASLLEIEITESVYMDPTPATKAFMQQLLGLGVHLSIDDFGSGYSAISYLSYLPFTQMKLDKTLLDNYTKNGDSKMIDGIIQLAHRLGLTVTAEGVEKEAQLELLRKFNCDYIQGYLWGRPLSAAAAETLLQNHGGSGSAQKKDGSK